MVKLRYTYKVLQHASKHRSFKWESVPHPSFIRWVKDGVVIVSLRADRPAAPVSFDVYLSADDLSTDLSGFKLQEAQNLERRLASGTAQVKSQAKKTIKAMQEHASKPTRVPPAAKIAGAIMVAAAPFTGGMTLPFVICGGLLVLALNGIRLQRHEVESDCLFRLHDLVRPDMCVQTRSGLVQCLEISSLRLGRSCLA